MTAAELDDIAERLFAHFVAHDLDAAEAMMAPGATLSRNGRGSTWTNARRAIEGSRAALGNHRYEEVRRVIGDHAVVEEHRFRSTTPAGVELDIAVCVVIRVDDEGRITSLDEYADTAALR